MPFNTTPEIDFSAIGLITDVPPHSLPPGAWSDCLNIRPKDASVQGVLDFKSAGINLFGQHKILQTGSCSIVTHDNQDDCEAATPTAGVWTVNPIVEDRDDAILELADWKGRIEVAEEDLQAVVDSTQDTLDAKQEILVDAQQVVIDKNEELDEAQVAYDILDSSLYDSWRTAFDIDEAATSAYTLLDVALDDQTASQAAYDALNTDAIYYCSSYDNNDNCDTTNGATESGARVDRDDVKDDLEGNNGAQEDWDDADSTRTTVETKRLNLRNAQIAFDTDQLTYDNTDVFDTDALDSAQIARDASELSLENAQTAWDSQSNQDDLDDLNDLDDALELAKANLEVAEATYSQVVFDTLQPELSDLQDSNEYLSEIRNIYDSLSGAKSNVTAASVNHDAFKELIEEREEAQEASDDLDDAIADVGAKQTAYDTDNTEANLAALDISQGELDTVMEAYTIGATLAEALEQAKERLDDSLEILHDSLSSYGSCDITGHSNKESCEANEGEWSVGEYTTSSSLDTATATQVATLETIVEDMQEYQDLSDLLFKENELSLTEAKDALDLAEEEKDAAHIAYLAAVYPNVAEAWDLYEIKLEAYNEALDAYNITAEVTEPVALEIKTDAASEKTSTYDAYSATENTAHNTNLTLKRDAVDDIKDEIETAETAVDTAQEVVSTAQDSAYEASVGKVDQDILDSFDTATVTLEEAIKAYQDALVAEELTGLSDATDTNISNGQVIAVTQFTPAGSDGLILAYIVKGSVDGKGHVLIYDVDDEVWNDVTPAGESHVFSFDDKHKPQLFVFNGCLIVNPATDCPPLWCEASIQTGSLIEMPDWFNDRYKEPGTDEVQVITLSGIPFKGNYPSFLSVTLDGEVKELDLDIFSDDTLDNVAVSLANAIGSYAVAGDNNVTITFPADYGNVPSIHSDSGDSGLVVSISTTTKGVAPVGTPLVTRILRPFNNRLIAMNVKEERDPDTTTDDEFLPIDFLWSGNIKTQGTLEGLEWAISSINTAGDSFLTQTPGKIVDGMQLGPYFMAYKEDAVIQASETGNAFVLNFRSVFEDDGLYSSGCVAPIGNNQHLVIGNYGVYIHDGQTQKQHIAKGIFQDFLFKAVDPAHKDRSFVFQQTRDKEIWFCFSSANNPNTGCNGAFVYDYEAQKLHRRTLPDVTDLYETELDGKLEIYGATKTGIQELDPEAYVSGGWFERRNESLQSNNFKTVTGCNIKSEGAVDVYSASNKNINDLEVYTSTSFDPAEDYKVNFRQNGRYLSIKIEMVDDSNEVAINPKLTTISFDMKETSRR